MSSDANHIAISQRMFSDQVAVDVRPIGRLKILNIGIAHHGDDDSVGTANCDVIQMDIPIRIAPDSHTLTNQTEFA